MTTIPTESSDSTPVPWDALRVIREKDGHSLSSLARLIDSSPGTLHDLESGRRRPTPPMIKRLATALNVPMSAIEPRRAL